MAHIKGADGTMHNVTSQGQGTLNTILGGIGTLGVLSGGNNGNCGGNGFLGGLFGGGNGNNHNNNCEPLVNRFELGLSMLAESRQAEVDALRTEIQVNEKITTTALTLNDKINSVTIGLNDKITAVATLLADLTCKQAVTNQKVEDSFTFLSNDINSKIALEAERRACGDQNIVAWTTGELYKKVNYAQYVDGSDVFCPQSNICGVLTANASADSVKCVNCKKQ